MLKKLIGILEGIPATAIGGVFLVLSFMLSKTGFSFLIDPAWITVFICGIPLLYSAIRKAICNKGITRISSALLISIAMIAAIIIGDLFAAGEVAFIMEIGGILEEMTTKRAKKGLKKLLSLTPTTGRKIVDGKEEIISAEDIKIGDVIRILPGESVTVDGIIINGETSIDQSVITGESLPIDKSLNDEVFCGTLNCFGAIDIKATSTFCDTSLQKLISMVKDAENKKAPMARIADKAAAWLVPLAFLIALLTGFITKDITRAVTVLVVFCPCALVLATPTAIMAAIGQATKQGVIIKSGEALEKMGKVTTVAFDKTGTLTNGNLEVSDIMPLNNTVTCNELLLITASAEAKSEHPLGKAICEYAKQKSVSLKESSEFKMTAGRGISAIINGDGILCGNESFLSDNGIFIDSKVSAQLEKLRFEGKASIITAKNGEVIGLIALSDTLRNDSANIINALKGLNVEAVLLTGDNQLTAGYFAEKTGIKTVKAELMPEQKVENIINLKENGKTVCMIGDGVNDAPALKTADVGIAMGSMGSDIAVEAADIALMSDDISKIPYLKRLSLATVKTIKFSITLSMIINILAVTLSVLGVLNPTTGALVHNAGSCFVILIAALLYDRKFK